MSFELPDLLYPLDALEPWIDAKTVEIHHTKHHVAYLNNLNAAVEKHPELFKLSIEQLLGDLSKIPEDIRTAVRNHGGGYYHHNIYFETIGPNCGGEPKGKVFPSLRNSFQKLP